MVVVEGENVLHHVKKAEKLSRGELPGTCQDHVHWFTHAIIIWSEKSCKEEVNSRRRLLRSALVSAGLSDVT